MKKKKPYWVRFIRYQFKCLYYLFFPGGLDFSDDKKDTDKILSKNNPLN
jgi:hypothetical protein